MQFVTVTSLHNYSGNCTADDLLICHSHSTNTNFFQDNTSCRVIYCPNLTDLAKLLIKVEISFPSMCICCNSDASKKRYCTRLFPDLRAKDFVVF